MVQHLDLEELAGADQVTRDTKVRLAGRGVSPGVVVHEDHRMGGGHNRGPEHFAGMDQHLVEDAGGHHLVALDVLAGGQQQHDERFLVGIVTRQGADAPPPVVGRVLRGLAFEQILRQRTVPQRHHLVFLGWLLLLGRSHCDLEQLGFFHDVSLGPSAC